MNLEKIIDRFVFENALTHGKAKTGSVMGALIAAYPELKGQVKEVAKLVASKVTLINKLDANTIKQTCRDKYPEIFEKEKKIKLKKTELPPLEGAIEGKVCTRLPPEPSGYLHIGHGYAGFINYYYAKRYNGKLILRFEDTNPRKVKLKYYDRIRDDYRHMGIQWDEEVNESDRIPIYYKYAQQLIKEGNAYVCSCPVKIVRECRAKKLECNHRDLSTFENMELWERMLEDSPEGVLALRLKIDMSHINAAMRDPSIMRVIESPHCLQGDKYRVWPLYDFAVSIEDSLLGITHVLRSEEFVQKVPLQNHIRDLLKLRSPKFIHFSRLRISDIPVQKRKIRELIEKGIISEWNDIRLSTLSGMHRRGIIPETIRQLAFEMQLSTGQSEVDLSILLALNRKMVDNIAKRCFAVLDPITLRVSGLNENEVQLDFHPKSNELGSRTIPYDGNFYISQGDLEILSLGEIIRLKDLVNIHIDEIKDLKGGQYVIEARYDANPSLNFPKIQWVPVNYCIEMDINIPGPLYIGKDINPHSLVQRSGYIEKSVLEFNEADLIQLERIGFGRIEKITSNWIEINLTEEP
ncbi:MAG: glutamate--tRNA ligase [Promethearchaeota archaeon]